MSESSDRPYSDAEIERMATKIILHRQRNSTDGAILARRVNDLGRGLQRAERISAAMLAALEALAGHTEGFCKRSGCPGCTQVLEEARAAIAAARGEQ